MCDFDLMVNLNSNTTPPEQKPSSLCMFNLREKEGTYERLYGMRREC